MAFGNQYLQQPDPLAAQDDEESQLAAELARIYGVDPNAQEPPPETFEPTGYQGILESLAGLQDIQGPAPRGFGQGLVSGLARGVGSAGSRVAKARAQFEARQQERVKANDASRLAASRAYRDKLADRAGERAKSARTAKDKQAEYERDNPPLTADMFVANPELRRLPLGTPIPRAWLKPEAPKAEPAYREERIPVTDNLLKEFPQFKGLKTIGADDLIKARTPSAASVKPSSGEQKTALGFYNRGKEALGVLDQVDQNGDTLENRIARVNPALAAIGQRVPGALKGTDRQLYEQAQKAFTQAKLRKESGAAISQSEYDQDAKTYFAQPGDSPEVIANKKAAREGVLEGLKFASGPAYQEFYGEPNTSAVSGSTTPRVRPPLASFDH